jgi:general L-amino acid transport system substrate-binding protein
MRIKEWMVTAARLLREALLDVSVPVGSVAALGCYVLLIGSSSVEWRSSTNRIAGIRSRNALTCGIWPHVEGFAIRHGETYVGLDVDICRAVAAAILGDPKRVKFVALGHIEQFRQRSDIDLVIRQLTWTLKREEAAGIVFGPVTFYDGQGFLVPRKRGISDIVQLPNKRICVMNMDDYPETLSTYFKESGLQIQLVLVKSDQEAEEALDRNLCGAYSADVSRLGAARAGLQDGQMRYNILSQVISKEPLAPMMRAEDTELLQLVRWTIYVMIEAEELGLTSRNISASNLGSLRVRRFLRVRPDSADTLDNAGWVRAIIAGVGNYGEVFERDLGAGSNVKLDRGLNRLWIKGGLMYAPPLDR